MKAGAESFQKLLTLTYVGIVLTAIGLPIAASASPILGLGITTIHVCRVNHPGSTACHGPTQAQLPLMSDSLVEFASAGIGATLFGAFSDSDGDIGNGDDFFLLHIQGGGGDQFLLDYVQLVFTNPVGFEFASTVTETPFLTFLPGFGPGDLPNVLGPPDGQQHVGLVGGRIVFAFPTSATSTAPEPPSFGLVALGVGRHVRRRCTSCGSAVGSEYHLTKALSNAGFFVTIGGKKVRPKIHP